jgi:aspartate aminotransferase
VIKVANPSATIWVSDPTWGNHIPLLGNCGLTIKPYPYFDKTRSAVAFDAMMSALSQVRAGDLVLIHGCCHNPSGADLNFAQWQAVTHLAEERGFTPFVDVAYQGFGEDIEGDVAGLRYLVERVPEAVVAASCSKNFGLYCERVGLAMVIGKNASAAKAVQSHMLSIVRGIYSMPPENGAALVALVLGDSKLRQQWCVEVAEMRDRINGLRLALSSALSTKLGHNHFDFIAQQKGMFSFLGLSVEQVSRLRDEFAIYLLDSSRASIAGLNNNNLAYVRDAVALVYNQAS